MSGLTLVIFLQQLGYPLAQVQSIAAEVEEKGQSHCAAPLDKMPDQVHVAGFEIRKEPSGPDSDFVHFIIIKQGAVISHG